MDDKWAWENELEAFKPLATAAWLRAKDYASPTHGRLVVAEDGITVNMEASQAMYHSEDGSKVTTNTTIHVKRQGFELGSPEVMGCTSSSGSSVIVSSYSPDSRYYATITSRKGKADEDTFHLTVTDRTTAVSTYLCLSAQKAHGPVCSDSQFGNLAWSPDCSKLLYVADEKAPASKSFFPPKLGPSDKDDEAVPGDENLFRDDWGEQLHKYHHTVLVIADWRAGQQSVNVLDKFPAGYSVGQPAFGPDGQSIVCVGWKEESPRLGLIYCTQRPSTIFSYDLLSEECTPISSGTTSVRSPMFSPSFDTLVYFEQEAGGPHHACSRLIKVDWASKALETLVPIVNSAPGNDFPGIFMWDPAAGRRWSSDGTMLYTDTQWRSEQVILAVDMKDGAVTRLSPASEIGSWHLLDVAGDVLLATYSNPASTPRLRLLFANQPAGDRQWTCITKSSSLPVVYTIQNLMPEGDSADPANSIPFQAILYHPAVSGESSKKKALPLVVMPHGGPHSCVSAGYSPSFAASCLLGYAVVAVNYRGSSGFGQDSILSLLGQIGVNDVHDVQTAAQFAVDEMSIDRAKVYVHGGSHGGFLAAHAIGQYPSYYRAACMRNPVIDLPSNLGVTDIPDWVLVEGGLEDAPAQVPSGAALQRLLERSPVVHVDKVSAATLMMIGELDARVPPSQGHRYISLLKHRNVKCRLLSYPKDCHPLSSVKTEADGFVNMFVWFQQALLE